MSRMPFRRPSWANFVNDPWLNFTGPSRVVDQHFGEMMDEEELANWNPFYQHGWGASAVAQPPVASAVARRPGLERGTSLVEYGDTHFKVSLDIRQFRPEEVNVKLVENRIMIHAKHEEREDQHGFIKREFTRSYVLPKDVDATKLEAKAGGDGLLRITAPRLQLDKSKETIIPIQHESAPSILPGTVDPSEL